MKNKSIENKLNAIINLIKSINKKKGNTQTGQTQVKLQSLESDLKATVGLQKDVQNLKDALKTRKKELKAGVKKLKKGSQEIKKAQKKDKKAEKKVKPEIKQKKVTPSKTSQPVKAKKNIVKSVKQ